MQKYMTYTPAYTHITITVRISRHMHAQNRGYTVTLFPLLNSLLFKVSNTCNILVLYCVTRTNSWKDKQGQSPWQHKQCTLNCKQRKHRTFSFTKLSDWMKVVKTKSCCHEMAFNLHKGETERRALKFIWHIYWISFVCLSGLYAGSSTPHHSTSVELLSPAPNPNSVSTTDLPSRQHRLDRDLGSPHHLSPLAAMDGTRDGWVLHGCIQLWRCVILYLLCHCQGRQRAGNINIKSGKMAINEWKILQMSGFVTVLSHDHSDWPLRWINQSGMVKLF